MFLFVHVADQKRELLGVFYHPHVALALSDETLCLQAILSQKSALCSLQSTLADPERDVNGVLKRPFWNVCSLLKWRVCRLLFYNNLLSFPFMLLSLFMSGELNSVLDYPYLRSINFQARASPSAGVRMAAYN